MLEKKQSPTSDQQRYEELHNAMTEATAAEAPEAIRKFAEFQVPYYVRQGLTHVIVDEEHTTFDLESSEQGAERLKGNSAELTVIPIVGNESEVVERLIHHLEKDFSKEE